MEAPGLSHDAIATPCGQQKMMLKNNNFNLCNKVSSAYTTLGVVQYGEKRHVWLAEKAKGKAQRAKFRHSELV